MWILCSVISMLLSKQTKNYNFFLINIHRGLICQASNDHLFFCLIASPPICLRLSAFFPNPSPINWFLQKLAVLEDDFLYPVFLLTLAHYTYYYVEGDGPGLITDVTKDHVYQKKCRVTETSVNGCIPLHPTPHSFD